MLLCTKNILSNIMFNFHLFFIRTKTNINSNKNHPTLFLSFQKNKNFDDCIYISTSMMFKKKSLIYQHLDSKMHNLLKFKKMAEKFQLYMLI